MRIPFLALASLVLLTLASPVRADVAINVDKDNQQMTVAVDGALRYRWPVSTGIPSRETPNGSFRAFRMEEDHYSKEFDDAPMPHSIFFTKIGHAIHGTDSVARLGTPASHGCVRLSRDNAATLYALVQDQGVLKTTVTLTGSSQVALARNPTRAARNNVPRDNGNAPRDNALPGFAPRNGYGSNGYPADVAGDPVTLAPPVQPQRQYAPQAMAGDDNYIYPADGSNAGARYPAPRGYRRAPPQDYQPRDYYYSQGGYDRPQVYVPQAYGTGRYD